MPLFEVGLFTIKDGREDRICKAYAGPNSDGMTVDIISRDRLVVGVAEKPLYIRSTSRTGIKYSVEAAAILDMDDEESPYFYRIRHYGLEIAST
jgi:hypothetical protein